MIGLESSIGRQFKVITLSKLSRVQRESLYVRGILPGRTLVLVHISPLGDPIVVQVATRKFALKHALWSKLELEMLSQ